MKMTSLHKGCVSRCIDDYTGIWEIIREVQRAYPDANACEVQDRTLGVIRDLLVAGYIVAGDLKDNVGVVPWPSSLEETIRRIKEEWNAFGREPSIWEIVWFDSTVEGKGALADDKELNIPEGSS